MKRLSKKENRLEQSVAKAMITYEASGLTDVIKDAESKKEIKKILDEAIRDRYAKASEMETDLTRILKGKKPLCEDFRNLVFRMHYEKKPRNLLKKAGTGCAAAITLGALCAAAAYALDRLDIINLDPVYDFIKNMYTKLKN